MADVTLPQLGETVTEGTITRWFKKVGDSVSADEPLFEVSTDKVDTEVPSPITGTVTEIRVTGILCPSQPPHERRFQGDTGSVPSSSSS